VKFIDLNNEILDILNEHSNWFFAQDFSGLHIDHNTDYDAAKASSAEYLEFMKSKPMGKEKGDHLGPPETVKNVHFGPGAKSDEKFKKESLRFQDELVKFLGAHHGAVHVYYPEDGFMGWHNNWDVPGWNILFNYNGGNGWFKYMDGDKPVVLEDPDGWSAKVGYFGDENNQVWHCAGGGPRITVGFVIPDKFMWEMMIEDIST